MLGRVLIAVAAVLLLLGGASCGGGEDQTTAPDTVEGTTSAGDGGTGTTTGAETETGGGTGTAGQGGRGDAAKGKQIFATQGCGGCHTLADAGSSGNVGPNLDESKPAFDLVVDRVTNGKAPMPSFKDKLSEQEIDDVAAYVSGAAGS